MYIVGFGGGPSRPTAPPAGLNTVPPAGALFARRQIAEVALNEIGIVDPGNAWMFVSCVGTVKLITTNAFGLPLTCHSPAAGAVGATVVATPRITEPKLRSLSVAMVMPLVTTIASVATA